MKRSFTISVLAMALSGLMACSQKEMDDSPMELAPSKALQVHFNARLAETKTVFGESTTDEQGRTIYPTRWSENDSRVMISLNYESGVVAGVNRQDETGEWASFDAGFDDIDTQSPYVFYVVSPADAFVWPSAEREAVSIRILGSQTPTAASLDENAQIIVAQSDSYSSIPTDVDVKFGHITAYGRLTLKNLSLAQGVSVVAVKILCDEQPIAGEWYYHFNNGSIEAKEPSSSLIINTANINVAAQDPIWFAVAPVGSMGGKALTIKAILSNGKALVKTINLKDGVTFSSGKIYQLSVKMDSATEEDADISFNSEETVYQLVTSTNNLAVNDEVIFADAASPTYAMGAYTSGTSGIPAYAKGDLNFTVGNDGYVRLPAGSPVVPFIIASKSNSSFSFKDASGKYLAGRSGGTRYLYQTTTSSTWSVSFTGSGGAARVTSNNRNIRYNNNYFNISSSSSNVYLFKKVTIGSTSSFDPDAAVVLNYDDYGAYLIRQNLVYNPSTDQLSREYNSYGTLTFAILAPEEDQVVEFSNIPTDIKLGDNFELGLTFISGITTEVNEVFSVYLVKEEGNTLWLSDAQGNGFIVKR